MTPSIKKLLKSKLSRDEQSIILSLLDKFGIDISIGNQSVYAADVIKYCDFDTAKIERFLKSSMDKSQGKRLAHFRELMNLVHFYENQAEDYYKTFACALESAARTLDISGLRLITSHGTLCIEKANEEYDHPMVFVIPLTDGNIFLTIAPEAHMRHKLPSLSEEIPGDIVTQNDLHLKLSEFLERAFQ